MSIYIREDDFFGSTSFPFLSYPATKKKELCDSGKSYPLSNIDECGLKRDYKNSVFICRFRS